MRDDGCPRCEASGHDAVFESDCGTCDGAGRVYEYGEWTTSSGGVSVITRVVGHRPATPAVDAALHSVGFDVPALDATLRAFGNRHYGDPNPTRIGHAKYGCPRDSDWCDGRICIEKGIGCPHAETEPV